MGLSTSQRALAHSASGADGFHHTRPPIKYASRSRGLTQVYVRTQLGGQSLQNGDIAGSSAATRKPGAKVLAKSSSGGFRPRTVPTDPLDGYAIADLPPDAMLAEAAAFAHATAGRFSSAKIALRLGAGTRVAHNRRRRRVCRRRAARREFGRGGARDRRADAGDGRRCAAGARRRAGRRRPRGDGARGAVGAAVCAARRLLRLRAAAAGDCAAAQARRAPVSYTHLTLPTKA